MDVLKIDKAKFDTFDPGRDPMIAAIADEKHWFQSETGSVIGTILLDKADQDWNIVVLGGDERGNFRAIKVEASIVDEQDAISRIQEIIHEYADSGEKVFPQGD